MNPKKNPQDLITQKLMVLIPNAKFSVRPYDNNSHLAVNPVIVGEFLVDWHSDNISKCPSIDHINAVDANQIDSFETSEKKRVRDEEKSKDLTMVACFDIEKKSNPDLRFTDYLDALELKAREMLNPVVVEPVIEL